MKALSRPWAPAEIVLREALDLKTIQIRACMHRNVVTPKKAFYTLCDAGESSQIKQQQLPAHEGRCSKLSWTTQTSNVRLQMILEVSEIIMDQVNLESKSTIKMPMTMPADTMLHVLACGPIHKSRLSWHALTATESRPKERSGLTVPRI